MSNNTNVQQHQCFIAAQQNKGSNSRSGEMVLRPSSVLVQADVRDFIVSYFSVHCHLIISSTCYNRDAERYSRENQTVSHTVTVAFTSGTASMKATIQREIAFHFWWAPANMKVRPFQWGGDVLTLQGLQAQWDRQGRWWWWGWWVSYFWAFIRLWALSRAPPECFGWRTGWRQTQNMLAPLCLSTSAEEHVQLQDKSFPPPFFYH